jgi:enoyl-CoA hydratase
MQLDHLVVESTANVLRVSINRPEKRNALSRAVLEEITRVFDAHADDPDLRLALLSAAGDKSFAAGGDLRDLATVRSESETLEMVGVARGALAAVQRFPVPVIAGLNGDALGGGAELAVACDFIVAAEHSRIGFIQGRLNIATAWGGGARLLGRVGPARALRLLTRSELLSPAQALAIGLIDQVAAAGESLDDALEAFYRPMLGQVPQVLRAFKALAQAGHAGADAQALERLETSRFIATWLHDDHWAAADRALQARRS